MTGEQELREFGANIQRLIRRENLTEAETYGMFRQVLGNSQPDLQQGAFLAALVSKRETIDEIVGAWRAIRDLDTATASVKLPGPVIENSGTGMDTLKTFNVSSAAGVVAAACGATMVRHGARALTSLCGTVDILESVGLDVECDVETVVRSIRREGIGLFNGTSAKVHPGGLGRILSQIRFGTTLNIAASLASPVMPSHGLRGVYSHALIDSVGEIMTAIGYERGMVVHGRADGHERGGWMNCRSAGNRWYTSSPVRVGGIPTGSGPRIWGSKPFRSPKSRRPAICKKNPSVSSWSWPERVTGDAWISPTSTPAQRCT